MYNAAASAARSLDLLGRWLAFSQRDWYPIPGHPDLGCYGTGYDHWGVQASMKFAAAAADWSVLADAAPVADRDAARDHALAAFRHAIRTHKSGDLAGTDGNAWGCTWISALGLERMAHAVPLLDPYLTDDDRARYRRVLVGEANWLTDSYEKGSHHGVGGSLWNHEGRNAPESNVWNGAMLWRASLACPEHARAAEWREQAHLFLINGTSVPADVSDAAVVAGKSVAERHRGPNFFPHYALDHHGYLNVGYMVITLSNVAMLHFDLQLEGRPAPESLRHHAADLWQVLRRFVFADGRLARIGGDTRLRYTYCQEYLLPVLLFAVRELNDAASAPLLDRQLDLIAQEAAANPDHSFYGTRLAVLRATQPYYYTRLESDRAAVLGQTALYLQRLPPLKRAKTKPVDFEASVAGAWCEPDHGVVVHRSATRLASFAWRSCGLAQALCQPPDDGHLAEWAHNLTGRIRFLGEQADTWHGGHRRLVRQAITPFDGGFATFGTIREGCRIALAEGYRRETGCADHHLAVAALPDGHTMVGLQFARTDPLRTFVVESWAIHLNLPNDLYNRYQRNVTGEDGVRTLRAPAAAAETLRLATRWACVEQRVGLFGIYGDDALRIRRTPERQAGPYPSLYIDELGWGGVADLTSCDASSTILDAGWAVVSCADALQTRAAWQVSSVLPADALDVRAVRVRGQDGRDYVVAANFGATPAQSPAPATARCVTPATSAELAPLSVAVWQV